MFCDAKIRRKNGTTKLSNLKLVKERLCYYSVFFCLFHRANHRLDELDFLVRQSVLLIEFLVRPRLREVLEGDEGKYSFRNIDCAQALHD